MRLLAPLFIAIYASLAAPSGAVSLSEDSYNRMASVDVVLLGEIHDNPVHHMAQAALVSRVAPAALVFEMLTGDQAAGAQGNLVADRGALADALGWADSGWPDFAMYHPIFLAAPDAAIFGAAIPRGHARKAMDAGLAETFGTEAEAYGLTEPLAATEQEQREQLQFRAHCDALPEEMLAAMVDVQRLRDARLAQVTLQALSETGGPVAVITGNGHARADWGIPRFLRRAAPGVTYFALGQTEEGAVLVGAFDAVLDAPGVDRPDPCEAFRK